MMNSRWIQRPHHHSATAPGAVAVRHFNDRHRIRMHCNVTPLITPRRPAAANRQQRRGRPEGGFSYRHHAQWPRGPRSVSRGRAPLLPLPAAARQSHKQADAAYAHCRRCTRLHTSAAPGTCHLPAPTFSAARPCCSAGRVPLGHGAAPPMAPGPQRHSPAQGAGGCFSGRSHLPAVGRYHCSSSGCRSMHSMQLHRL